MLGIPRFFRNLVFCFLAHCIMLLFALCFSSNATSHVPNDPVLCGSDVHYADVWQHKLLEHILNDKEEGKLSNLCAEITSFADLPASLPVFSVVRAHTNDPYHWMTYLTETIHVTLQTSQMKITRRKNTSTEVLETISYADIDVKSIQHLAANERDGIWNSACNWCSRVVFCTKAREATTLFGEAKKSRQYKFSFAERHWNPRKLDMELPIKFDGEWITRREGLDAPSQHFLTEDEGRQHHKAQQFTRMLKERAQAHHTSVNFT